MGVQASSAVQPRGQSVDKRARYEALARQLAKALHGFAWRLVRPDHELAEDLVQNALVTGYRLYVEDRFDPTLGALTWFATTIRNDFLACLLYTSDAADE